MTERLLVQRKEVIRMLQTCRLCKLNHRTHPAKFRTGAGHLFTNTILAFPRKKKVFVRELVCRTPHAPLTSLRFRRPFFRRRICSNFRGRSPISILFFRIRPRSRKSMPFKLGCVHLHEGSRIRLCV